MNPETTQLELLLIIHVAMGAVAPTQLAPTPSVATVGPTRASRADVALRRLAVEEDPEVEVATDSLADSGDCDEALDALCEDRRTVRHTSRAKIAFGRAVMKNIREINLTTSCPAVHPDDVAITYTTLTNDSVVTVREARAMTFSKPLGRSTRVEAEVCEVTASRCIKVRSATIYRHSFHMKAAWENMLVANSRHASANMVNKWDETQQLVGIGSAALVPEGLCDRIG